MIGTGEYTYAGAREYSVIDYVIVSDEVQERIQESRVERMDSNHLPLRLEMEKGKNEKKIVVQDEKEDDEQVNMKRIINWDKEARSLFKEKTNDMDEVIVYCRSNCLM